MRSAARLTYTGVQRAIDGTPDAEIAPLDGDVFRPLYSAYKVLLRRATSAARSTSISPERQVTLGNDGASPRSACASGSTATS